jgi:predicted N-formylglutamate amidohydrolase
MSRATMIPPFHIEGENRASRWIVTVDHASNRVPGDVCGGDLGLSPEDMNRHIAWDPGALGVARALARRLDAPMIASDFSRLVIDPNRGEADPTLLLKLYDGTVIPANRHADAAEVERRLERYHRPYHRALEGLIAAREAPLLVAIHSFTRQFRGRPPRPWHVGVLYGGDSRLALPLIARLNAEPDLCVGDNEPYSGHLPGDSMDRHGVQPGRPHVLIEVRNDLIRSEAEQTAWGERLAPLLDAAGRIAQV